MDKITKQSLMNSITDLVWMARRYSNKRKTYAPGIFNDAYDTVRREFGDAIDANTLINEKNEVVYDVAIETSSTHPYAIYGDDMDSQSNRELTHRPFYKKPKLKKTL